MNASSSPSRRRLGSAILDYAVELLMAFLPQNALSMKIKAWSMRTRGSRIGQRTKIWRNVWVDDLSCLRIDDDVTIGHGALLICGGGVHIAARTMIAHGAKLLSSGHRIPATHDEPLRWTGPEQAPIEIAEDVWVGAGAIVLGGVCIGRGAIVAAGAVVTKNVPEYCVVAGIPASIVRKR